MPRLAGSEVNGAARCKLSRLVPPRGSVRYAGSALRLGERALQLRISGQELQRLLQRRCHDVLGIRLTLCGARYLHMCCGALLSDLGAHLVVTHDLQRTPE